jgi:hypothetical protein
MEALTTWSTDPQGRLALAGLHDSQVKGFSHRDRTFRISLASAESRPPRTELELRGVQLLYLDAVWEATIVLDVFVWNAHDVPEDFRLDPNAGWSHLLKDRGGDRTEIDRSIERALRALPGGFLVSVTGSYGGSVSALCTEVLIYQEQGFDTGV